MGHKLDIQAAIAGPKIKRNYFVPHFGEDPDITATKNNIAAAETEQGHEIGASKDGHGSFEFVQTNADIKQ